MYCDTWSWHSEDRTYQGRELVQIEMKATGAKEPAGNKDVGKRKSAGSKDIKKKPAGAKHNCGKRKSAGAKATKKKPAGIGETSSRSHGKC